MAGFYWLRVSLGWEKEKVKCTLRSSPYGASCHQTVQCVKMFKRNMTKTEEVHTIEEEAIC